MFCRPGNTVREAVIVFFSCSMGADQLAVLLQQLGSRSRVKVTVFFSSTPLQIKSIQPLKDSIERNSSRHLSLAVAAMQILSLNVGHSGNWRMVCSDSAVIGPQHAMPLADHVGAVPESVYQLGDAAHKARIDDLLPSGFLNPLLVVKADDCFSSKVFDPWLHSRTRLAALQRASSSQSSASLSSLGIQLQRAIDIFASVPQSSSLLADTSPSAASSASACKARRVIPSRSFSTTPGSSLSSATPTVLIELSSSSSSAASKAPAVPLVESGLPGPSSERINWQRLGSSGRTTLLDEFETLWQSTQDVNEIASRLSFHGLAITADQVRTLLKNKRYRNKRQHKSIDRGE